MSFLKNIQTKLFASQKLFLNQCFLFAQLTPDLNADGGALPFDKAARDADLLAKDTQRPKQEKHLTAKELASLQGNAGGQIKKIVDLEDEGEFYVDPKTGAFGIRSTQPKKDQIVLSDAQTKGVHESEHQQLVSVGKNEKGEDIYGYPEKIKLAQNEIAAEVDYASADQAIKSAEQKKTSVDLGFLVRRYQYALNGKMFNYTPSIEERKAQTDWMQSMQNRVSTGDQIMGVALPENVKKAFSEVLGTFSPNRTDVPMTDKQLVELFYNSNLTDLDRSILFKGELPGYDVNNGQLQIGGLTLSASIDALLVGGSSTMQLEAMYEWLSPDKMDGIQFDLKAVQSLGNLSESQLKQAVLNAYHKFGEGHKKISATLSAKQELVEETFSTGKEHKEQVEVFAAGLAYTEKLNKLLAEGLTLVEIGAHGAVAMSQTDGFKKIGERELDTAESFTKYRVAGRLASADRYSAGGSMVFAFAKDGTIKVAMTLVNTQFQDGSSDTALETEIEAKKKLGTYQGYDFALEAYYKNNFGSSEKESNARLGLSIAKGKFSIQPYAEYVQHAYSDENEGLNVGLKAEFRTTHNWFGGNTGKPSLDELRQKNPEIAPKDVLEEIYYAHTKAKTAPSGEFEMVKGTDVSAREMVKLEEKEIREYAIMYAGLDNGVVFNKTLEKLILSGSFTGITDAPTAISGALSLNGGKLLIDPTKIPHENATHFVTLQESGGAYTVVKLVTTKGSVVVQKVDFMSGLTLEQVNQIKNGTHSIDEAFNEAPRATTNAISTNEDTPVSGTLAATDPEGDSLTYQKVSNPSHGTVVINANGSYTYTPAANYSGTDTFRYKVNDGELDSAVQTVTVTINAVNDAPTATTAMVNTNEDTPVSGTLTGTDQEGDNLIYQKSSDPSHGTVVINANGSYTYTPSSNYNGNDSFSYKVNDGTTDSAVRTVTVAINAVNDAPTATTTTASTNENTPLNGTLTGTDIDGDSLTYEKVSDPSHGTLTINANGSYTYTPSAGYNGADSFSYKVNDGTINSAVRNVSVTVNAVNDAPTATTTTASTNEDTTLNGALTGTDPEGSSLTYEKVGNPSHGTLTINANGTYTYIPDANYNGGDSFSYKVNDGSLDSAVRTVTVTVHSIDDHPDFGQASIGGVNVNLLDNPGAGISQTMVTGTGIRAISVPVTDIDSTNAYDVFASGGEITGTLSGTLQDGTINFNFNPTVAGVHTITITNGPETKYLVIQVLDPAPPPAC